MMKTQLEIDTNIVSPAQEILPQVQEIKDSDLIDKKSKFQGKKVLDHMARIDIDFDPDQPLVFSYHYQYKDYLEINGYVDPERAKMEEEMQQRKNQKKTQTAQDENKPKPKEEEGEDLSQYEEASYQGPMAGKQYKFDSMIKSMMARIELCNSLAPIQEYGRHQTKTAGNKKKKQKKKPAEGEKIISEHQSEGMEIKYDDNFYDLDDDFIDDEDMQHIEDELATEMLYEDKSSSNFTAVMEMQKARIASNQELNEEQEEKKMEEEDQYLIELKEKRKYQKLLKSFRVLLPQEVEQMLKDRDEKEQKKLRKNSEANIQQLTINQMLPVQQKPQSLNLQGSGEKQRLTKKRDRDEMSNSKLDDIDDMLDQLKQRVLHGETLNNFKREMQMLADMVEKKDPDWSEIAEKVARKLADVLSKPEQEMMYMLQRNNIMEKRKKKKNDLEKLSNMLKGKIEMDLKNYNKKSEHDFITLDQIQPNALKFQVTKDLLGLIQGFTKKIQEFVTINNEYLEIKQKEEKTKAKRQKIDPALVKPFELINAEQELMKQIDQLVNQIPESIRRKVQDTLLVAFGLKSSASSPNATQEVQPTNDQKEDLKMKDQEVEKDKEMEQEKETLKEKVKEKEKLIEKEKEKEKEKTKPKANEKEKPEKDTIQLVKKAPWGNIWNKVRGFPQVKK